MEKVVKLTFVAILSLFLSFDSVYGYSTHPTSTNISRNFDKLETSRADAITVTTTFFHLTGNDLRGFYYTEHIPEGLVVNTISVKINGNDITNHMVESGSNGDVYPGYVPFRWILEIPPSFAENNPLSPYDSLVIVYTVTALHVGAFNFDEFSWVGYFQSAQAAAFGYSEQIDKQSIKFATKAMPWIPVLLFGD
jgi:hypothetical protein